MKRKNLALLVIFLSFLIGSIFIYSLYVFYFEEIINYLNTVEESIFLVIIILIKIVIISSIGCFLLYKWYHQEDQYYSDIRFLFSIFFFFLVFAKTIDIVINLVFFQVSSAELLILSKIRFLLMVINVIPMLFLSIEMILIYFSLMDRFKKLRNKAFFKKIQKITLILIALLESIAILLAPTYSIIITIYPFISLTSLLIIFWMFLFAYRTQRLSDINPLIVALGFGIFLLTSIFRTLGHNLIDPKVNSIISEILEIIVFAIIFIGLIKKANYYKS